MKPINWVRQGTNVGIPPKDGRGSIDIIASCMGPTANDAVLRAEHIVEIHNSHEALVEACLDFVESHKIPGEWIARSGARRGAAQGDDEGRRSAPTGETSDLTPGNRMVQ